ncbi:MAG: glutamate--cysteine ligase [Pseudohongiellaceae bacterium]
MSKLAIQRIKQLSETGAFQHLRHLQRGIEKESLRISPDGMLATTEHPKALGSALTHPKITTDFSEALLELITPVHSSINSVLTELNDIHRYVYSQLDNELMWTASMPCALPEDSKIPVAQFGSSNVAKMKSAYRVGLGNRYGRTMQTISGIHYNFSIPEALWPHLQNLASDDLKVLSAQDFKTESYFHLIRNFRRVSWLLTYLYGSSPAVCKSFLKNQPHNLEELNDGSFYLPYATALRMGDFGYQSNAQNGLQVCYNTIDNYIQTLKHAIITEHPEYKNIGVKEDSQYQQLSSALLQIENEFYSTIRPKRVTESGEIPLGALQQRGVEYIEVRCIDVNPYLPMGIDEDEIRFIDCLMLFCLLDESPKCDEGDMKRIDENFKTVVNFGRKPGLTLKQRQGDVSLQGWGTNLLDGIEAIAQYMDKLHGGDDYSRVCQDQKDKLNNPELTPSAKVLADMGKKQQSYFDFALDLSKQHQQSYIHSPLTGDELDYFATARDLSNQRREEIEQDDTIDFDEYLVNFYQQYHQL